MKIAMYSGYRGFGRYRGFGKGPASKKKCAGLVKSGKKKGKLKTGYSWKGAAGGCPQKVLSPKTRAKHAKRAAALKAGQEYWDSEVELYRQMQPGPKANSGTRAGWVPGMGPGGEEFSGYGRRRRSWRR